MINEHIPKWINDGATPTEFRLKLRDLNLKTSQTVFIGPYLPQGEPSKKFGDNYLLKTEGFLAFPIPLPGTALSKAIQGRIEVVNELVRCSQESKAKMAAGGEPVCLLDYWSQRINEEIAEAKLAGEEPGEHCKDSEMGDTMMDFLFAAQDASTSSLTWAATFMCERPDILAKVREEQQRLRPNNEALNYEMVESLTYTRAVIKEILRFRPPATMVPSIAMVDFRLNDKVVAPKGSLVCPSIWAACFQGFTNPESFDPERMTPERHEDVTYRDNFLTFGVGPHMCVGQQYAINHLVAFLSLFSQACDWTRTKNALSDNILYLPTLYPTDCLLTVKARIGFENQKNIVPPQLGPFAPALTTQE